VISIVAQHERGFNEVNQRCGLLIAVDILEYGESALHTSRRWLDQETQMGELLKAMRYSNVSTGSVGAYSEPGTNEALSSPWPLVVSRTLRVPSRLVLKTHCGCSCVMVIKLSTNGENCEE
jgi:hypothetical protein